MATSYDVIVVGAGPAGATAAYQLARAGLRTLVLEKETMPRYKPCGGGLTRKVRRPIGSAFDPVVEDAIARASVALGPESVRLEFGETVGWCVMRSEFDQLLAHRAEAAGAELREDAAVTGLCFDDRGVTVSTASESYQARMVVGTDGVNGIVRRAAGFPPHPRVAAALEAEMEAPVAALEAWRGALHFDFAIPWGYAWIFPKAEHLSVGIGVLPHAGPRPDLRALLNRYIASEPTLAGARTRLLRGYRIPLGGVIGRYHKPGVILAGDAAGVADPFTAEGIYYAIRSGEIAAEEIRKGFARGDFNLARYSRRLNREIQEDFQVAWTLAQIFFRAPHRWYSIFQKSPGARALTAKMVNGEIDYRHMVWGGASGLARRLSPWTREKRGGA